MWTNWGPTQVGSGKFFSPYPSGPLMRQERLLSVSTDGGGYITFLCTNKDDFSLTCPNSNGLWFQYADKFKKINCCLDLPPFARLTHLQQLQFALGNPPLRGLEGVDNVAALETDMHGVSDHR